LSVTVARKRLSKAFSNISHVAAVKVKGRVNRRAFDCLASPADSADVASRFVLTEDDGIR
jgi:hypothetical protein